MGQSVAIMLGRPTSSHAGEKTGVKKRRLSEVIQPRATTLATQLPSQALPWLLAPAFGSLVPSTSSRVQVEFGSSRQRFTGLVCRVVMTLVPAFLSTTTLLWLVLLVLIYLVQTMLVQCTSM